MGREMMKAEYRFSYRQCQESDLPQMVETYRKYMKDYLKMDTPIDESTFKRDGFGNRFDVQIAVCDLPSDIAGFAVWQSVYDLHWGISGGDVIDLYVDKKYRGYGLAPRMLSSVAKNIANRGGVFLAGQGLENETKPAELYQKIAMGFPGVNCILGGKAFRVFAELEGKSTREFVNGLPLKEWNYLP
jgi:ribosomal protein S18 acetylase RimI-like enzyme